MGPSMRLFLICAGVEWTWEKKPAARYFKCFFSRSFFARFDFVFLTVSCFRFKAEQFSPYTIFEQVDVFKLLKAYFVADFESEIVDKICEGSDSLVRFFALKFVHSF